MGGMKNDFGGHDNHHFDNIYAYIGRAMGVTGTLDGHEDYFYGNKVVLTKNQVGGVQCKDVKTVLHDNSYYTPDGTLQECGVNLTEAQSQLCHLKMPFCLGLLICLRLKHRMSLCKSA